MIFKKKKEKNWDFNGIQTRGLCVKAADISMLQCYNATMLQSNDPTIISFVGMKLSEWPCQFFFLMLLAGSFLGRL